ncbi:MAG: 3-phosphoshikimate 1-carboxyvinyltransferase [Cyclobacteriaceae bacterium]
MKYHLPPYEGSLNGPIKLTSSKSESNRALLMNALSGNKLTLDNLSTARDTETMMRLMEEASETWDVLDAGTTMRFCTAYLAIFGKGETVTGTPRMLERPIGLLVEALKQLGAKIKYEGKEGYPPLTIEKIEKQLVNKIKIPGNISSQYISAILMIAPYLENGLEIILTTEVYSEPYINMTIKLMERFGVKAKWIDNVIKVPAAKYKMGHYTIESDWSGASYWYSMAALNMGAQLKLEGLREKSFQGDQAIVKIMANLGVNTIFDDKGANLVKVNSSKKEVTIDFRSCPDLAQTVMVTAAAKGTKLIMTGLESLKIKETDRIAAMTAELAKINALLTEENGVWKLIPGELPDEVTINTYDDHRMAMAFAPLAMKMDVNIMEPDVVKKSYPSFWNDCDEIGIIVNRRDKKR